MSKDDKKDISGVEKSARDVEIDEIIALVKKHEETIASFRISFKNLEYQLNQLKQRNRLR